MAKLNNYTITLVQALLDKLNSGRFDRIITLSTNISLLVNNLNFIDKTVTDLVNYYTKEEVDNMHQLIRLFKYTVASELPTASIDTMYKIYLIPASRDNLERNLKLEYITVLNGTEPNYTYSWEKIGDTEIDLAPYLTRAVSITIDSTNYSDIESILNALKILVEDAKENIGDLLTLTTTDKTSLVDAINEVDAATSTLDSTMQPKTMSSAITVAGTSQTTVESTLGALNSNLASVTATVGDKSTLSTTDKTDIVSAINEVNSQVANNTTAIGTVSSLTTTATDLTTAVNELNSDKQPKTLSEIITVDGVTKTSVEDTLRSVANIASASKTDIGDLTLLETTGKSTLVGAINELVGMGVEPGAQVNGIETIQLNGTSLTVSQKSVNIEPTASDISYDNTTSGLQATNAQDAIDELAPHITDTNNPHSVTATQVGLGNCDNTSDVDKPISTATQTALDAKQNSTITAINVDGTDKTTVETAITAVNTLAAANKTNIGTLSSLSTTEKGSVVSAINELNTNKVDIVAGKQLSTEDYTTAEQTKLSGIETGAQVNVLANWNQTTDTADDFIKNKPTLGSAAAKAFTTYINPDNPDLPTSAAVHAAMTSMLEGAFKPAGNKTIAELTSDMLVLANIGKVYKITDSGVTNEYWMGGAGQTITAGQMAVIVYGNAPDTYVFNLEAGINIDMSSYLTKAITPISVDGVSKMDVEDTLTALNTLAASNKTDKADKVISATSGDLATLNASGNITDSGVAATDLITKSSTAGLVKNDGTIDTTTYVSDISGKADIVTSAINGNFAGLDSNGNLTDSGSKASDFASSAIMDGTTIDSFGDVESALSDKISTSNTAGLVKNDGTIDTTTYADKSELTITAGTGTDADKTTIQLKTGTSATVLTAHQSISDKADKIIPTTAGNLAALDSSGNLTDSGKSAQAIKSLISIDTNSTSATQGYYKIFSGSSTSASTREVHLTGSILNDSSTITDDSHSLIDLSIRLNKDGASFVGFADHLPPNTDIIAVGNGSNSYGIYIKADTSWIKARLFMQVSTLMPQSEIIINPTCEATLSDSVQTKYSDIWSRSVTEKSRVAVKYIKAGINSEGWYKIYEAAAYNQGEAIRIDLGSFFNNNANSAHVIDIALGYELSSMSETCRDQHSIFTKLRMCHGSGSTDKNTILVYYNKSQSNSAYANILSAQHSDNGEAFNFEAVDATQYAQYNEFTLGNSGLYINGEKVVTQTDLTPVGVILPYGGSSAPSGWLLCNGSAVSRTTYANLFAVIGTSFGAGNGSTTFNLPDMREAVPKGAGLTGKTVSAHIDSDGLAVGEFIDDRAQTHTHSWSNTHNHDTTESTHSHTWSNTHSHSITDPGHTHSHTAGTSFGNRGGTYSTVPVGESSSTGSSTTGITIKDKTISGTTSSTTTGLTVNNKTISGTTGNNSGNSGATTEVKSVGVNYIIKAF